MPQFKPGTRLKSAVCNSEVMVVLAPATDVELTCGGAAMVEMGGYVFSTVNWNTMWVLSRQRLQWKPSLILVPCLHQ